MRILLVMIVLVSSIGCPDQQASSGPVDTCERAGQQCRLGGGQLGVCAVDAQQQLQCTSQH